MQSPYRWSLHKEERSSDDDALCVRKKEGILLSGCFAVGGMLHFDALQE